MATGDYTGLLFIADPHLTSRVPGFRKDDYPAAILGKLRWAFDYAREHCLLTVLLGDVFHYPRDNDNWLLGEVIELFRLQDNVLVVYGNHDCRENQLGENDSLSVVLKAGVVRPLTSGSPWVGEVGDRSVVVGGTPWGRRLPSSFDASAREQERPLVFWAAHHDVSVPGYDEGHLGPYEIEGVDMVVNGHIHRQLEDVRRGQTLWVTPGGIARVSRSDAMREHTPAILQVDVVHSSFEFYRIEVPHEPFVDVFHAEMTEPEEQQTGSSFIAGLAELQARRTEGGAGLAHFLEQNVGRFEERVAQEIMALAEEVREDGK